MHACTPICKPAQGTCTRARRSASQHEAYALVHTDLQASTRHMLVCTPLCKLARQSIDHLRCNLLKHERGYPLAAGCLHFTVRSWLPPRLIARILPFCSVSFTNIRAQVSLKIHRRRSSGIQQSVQRARTGVASGNASFVIAGVADALNRSHDFCQTIRGRFEILQIASEQLDAPQLRPPLSPDPCPRRAFTYGAG